jgi:hypothetical protein
MYLNETYGRVWVGNHLSGVIQSFIRPTNAQLNYFKILKFTRFTINAPTFFGLTKPSSGSLQSVLR